MNRIIFMHDIKKETLVYLQIMIISPISVIHTPPCVCLGFQ